MTAASISGAETAIVIAAYNAEATLDRAVQSALAQPEATEICVVDDASRDGTAALARSWAEREPRVQVISLSVNAGPSAARNAAIAATRSPWITILDADDYMLPGRLAGLHRAAGDADFIADALIRVIGAAPPPPAAERLQPTPLSFTDFVIGNLGIEGTPLDLGFLKPMFRRRFVERHSLSYREDMRLGEDYEFYARALALGAWFLVCEPAGYVSVEREGSLSKAHSEADLQLLRDCDDKLATIRAFDAEERRALRRHRSSVDCRLQWRRLITAVKTRDIPGALSTFRSPQTSLFLAARLGEQAWLRGKAAARSDGSPQGAVNAQRART